MFLDFYFIYFQASPPQTTPHTVHLIISPNEVFGDIMVLASPPRPPRRREHSNSKSIQPISFKFYMRVDTPLRFFAIEI